MGLSTDIQAGILRQINKQGHEGQKLLTDDVPPVVVRVTNDVTQDMGSVTTPTKIEWNTTVFDTFGGMDLANNEWIVPLGGYYQISGSWEHTGKTWAVTVSQWLSVYVNGIVYTDLHMTKDWATNEAGTLAGSTLIELDIDDIVSFYYQKSSAAGFALKTAAPLRNYFSIHRVRG